MARSMTFTNGKYEKIGEVLGGGIGHRIETYGELVKGLTTALNDSKSIHVLNVLLDPGDRSLAMTRVAHRLAKRLAKKKN